MLFRSKRILSEKGVLLKKHLLEGAKKGAFSVEEAEVRFSKWMNDKSSRVANITADIQKSAADLEKLRFDAETKAREAIAAKVARKLSAAVTEAADGGAEESPEGAE